MRVKHISDRKVAVVLCLLVTLMLSCTSPKVLVGSADKISRPTLSELKPGEKFLFYTNESTIYKLRLREVGEEALHGNMKILNARKEPIGKCADCTLSFDELLTKTTKIEAYKTNPGATIALVLTAALVGLIIYMATSFSINLF